MKRGFSIGELYELGWKLKLVCHGHKQKKVKETQTLESCQVNPYTNVRENISRVLLEDGFPVQFSDTGYRHLILAYDNECLIIHNHDRLQFVFKRRKDTETGMRLLLQENSFAQALISGHFEVGDCFLSEEEETSIKFKAVQNIVFDLCEDTMKVNGLVRTGEQISITSPTDMSQYWGFDTLQDYHLANPPDKADDRKANLHDYDGVVFRRSAVSRHLLDRLCSIRKKEDYKIVVLEASFPLSPTGDLVLTTSPDQYPDGNFEVASKLRILDILFNKLSTVYDKGFIQFVVEWKSVKENTHVVIAEFNMVGDVMITEDDNAITMHCRTISHERFSTVLTLQFPKHAF